MDWLENLNKKVAGGPVGRWFRLDGSGHAKSRKGSLFTTEIRAGIVAFFAMAYIIAVNASIVSDTGGTCVCHGEPDDPICAKNEEYALCAAEVKRDMVTATAAIAALTSFCMGFFANLPVSLAPVAVTAIFVEGWIFFALALFGLRQWLARAIPRSIKLATGVGIGLFLTIIGLTYSEGIGLIVGGQSTPLELAGCLPGLKGTGDADPGMCPDSGKMRNPTMWIGIFCGGILTVLLMMYRVKGAIIAGITLVSIISWPRTTDITYFPYTPVGDDAFNFFKKVVDFHQIQHTLVVQEWDIAQYGGQFGLALVTFLYVDILDCTGTLYSMAHFADLIDPVTQDFEGSSLAYMVDAIGISIGALLGTPPVTAFVESGAGISDGGKTGLTSMTTGICFFISVFFAPIFASIPPWATGCVLVLVGSMMVKSVTEINWRYMGDAIPAFITIALMPFTYSIANGLIGGVCSYILINSVVWLVEKASGGRVVPHDKDLKDPWTWRIPGGIFPLWTRRLASGKKDFWREDEVPVHESASHAGLQNDANGEKLALADGAGGVSDKDTSKVTGKATGDKTH
ncbi:hypothetical protein PG994_004792 [Apiospora phragmitis]|uniref:NCS2 family permease n=1 Tax=Apiospora phragmitis TaxID=2905665 RepID=A0ABR1VVL1_9PEZI